MSGIIGIWNLDGRPVAKELLSKMSATLAHRGPDGEGQWIDGPVGLACQLMRVTPESLTETQPLVHPSGVVIVFDGRLDNREELLAHLKGTPGIQTDSSDAALVGAAYETWGESLPEKLNGDFALAVFDPRRRKLILARDAIGLRTLYYCPLGDTFIFASEIKALLAHPQVSFRPNDDVLAEFLFYGPPPENLGETFFSGIYTMPPGYMAVLSLEKFVVRRYWDFDLSSKIRFKSFEDYAEAFHHLFEAAVRRRLRSAYPVGVSVSGGLDSSSIFCQGEVLRRTHPGVYPPLVGVCWKGPEGSLADEDSLIEEIERAYGLDIHRVPLGPNRFMKDVEKYVWHAEMPFLDLQWRELTSLQLAASQHGARVFLTGHWGDQLLLTWQYFTDLFQRLEWGKLWTHIKEFPRWNVEVHPHTFYSIFFRDMIKSHIPEIIKPALQKLRAKMFPAHWDRPWYTETFRQRALRAPWVRAERGKGSTYHAQSIYNLTRSRHAVMQMEFLIKEGLMVGVETAFPMLDRDLVTFLMAIPGDIRNWQGIPRMMVRRAMEGILPPAIAWRRWKALFSFLMDEGIAQDYAQAARYLHKDMIACKLGYVNENIVEDELGRIRSLILNPYHATSWHIRDILGLELWLQFFSRRN